jgi:hypothetical protein
MSKLLRILALGAFCLVLTVGTTGCPKKPVEKGPAQPRQSLGDRFWPENERASLDGNRNSAEITFKNGVPKSVEPAQKDGVKAAVVGDKVVIQRVGDAPAEDKKIEFTVKNKDNEAAIIKITVKKKD